MLTRKQYRTIKQIKPYIVPTVLTTTLIILGLTQLKPENPYQEIEQYKQCIQQQSQEHGYIIRSQCSSNYTILDQLSELKYIQIGYDLYLKQ